MRAPQLLERIEVHPEVMLGKPVIRGTRITVEILLEKLAAGANTEEILADYPDLERDDVLAALAYARQAALATRPRGLSPRAVRAEVHRKWPA